MGPDKREDLIDDLSLRVAQATPAQLVVLAYDLTCGFIKDALAEDDGDDFASLIERAKNGVAQLLAGLDLRVDFSWELYDIYLYVHRTLSRASVRRDRAAAEEALSLLGTLHDAFAHAAKQEGGDGAAAAETQAKVFAGLTYRRGGLTEYVDQDESRGYKA